jgi:hypothetical protein
MPPSRHHDGRSVALRSTPRPPSRRRWSTLDPVNGTATRQLDGDTLTPGWAHLPVTCSRVAPTPLVSPCSLHQSHHPLYLSGSYTRVLRASGYGLIYLNTMMFPPSKKWLGNQVPHTGYGPTTPSSRGGTTNWKELNPGMVCTSPFYPPSMDAGG